VAERARRGRGRSGRPRLGRLSLRLATHADLATLVVHRRKMWQELRAYSRRELDRHDVAYRRWMRELMGRRKFLAWIVEEPRTGAVVGSGAVWLMPSQPRPGTLGRGEIPYILSMYTEPAYRRRGVASRIVRAMVGWSRAHRYGRVLLHASRFGRPVYERLGFESGSEMRLALVRLPPERR